MTKLLAPFDRFEKLSLELPYMYACRRAILKGRRGTENAEITVMARVLDTPQFAYSRRDNLAERALKIFMSNRRATTS